jgi:phosphate transport system substrate-binding protein
LHVAGGGSSIGLLTAWTTNSPTEDIGASSSIWSAKTVNGVNIPSREDAIIQLAGADAKVYETKIGTGMIVLAGNLVDGAGIKVTTINITNGADSWNTATGVLSINFTTLQGGYTNGTIATNIIPGFAPVITTVQRSDPSGTEDTFAAWIKLEDATTTQLLSTVNAVGKQGNQGIRDYISGTSNTLGFVDIGYTAGQTPNGAANVLAATQNGISASLTTKGVGNAYDTASNAVNGVSSSKGLARDLYYYNQGLPTGAIKAYLDWIMTPDGQKIVQAEGFFSN